MAAIYLLRCSLHAVGIKKTGSQLLRWRVQSQDHATSMVPTPASPHLERPTSNDPDVITNRAKVQERVVDNARNWAGDIVSVSMLKMLFVYGGCLSVGAVAGGFGCLPSISAGALMFKLGARSLKPQYGSNVLLFCLYMRNFAPIAFVPKPAFSCMLVLAAIDMLRTWLFQSYTKTKNKGEWLVVPFISIATYVIGNLQSVALGIALSTFIFVESFYRTGVVKFIASGKCRSLNHSMALLFRCDEMEKTGIKDQ